MSGLQWNGTEVRLSCLGHKAFKAAPCEFLLLRYAGTMDKKHYNYKFE